MAVKPKSAATVTCLLLLLLQTSWNLECSPLDSCSCRTSDGRVLDLSPLASSNTSLPRFFDLADAAGENLYSWNPCRAFSEGDCLGVAVCQHVAIQTKYGKFYGLGWQNTSTFVSNSDIDAIQLVYSQTSPQELKTRTTIIDLICDPSKTAELVVKGEAPTLRYNFELWSKYACLRSTVTTTASPVTSSARPTRPHPHPGPPPGPTPFYSLRTVVLLLLGILFCLALLVLLVLIGIFMAQARLAIPAPSKLSYAHLQESK